MLIFQKPERVREEYTEQDLMDELRATDHESYGQMLAQFITALKEAHRKLHSKVIYTVDKSASGNLFMSTLYFYDPRFPKAKAIGKLELSKYSASKYALYNRFCKKSRERDSFCGMKPDNTSSLEKVVKLAVKNVTPYKISEIAEQRILGVFGVLDKWKREANAGYSPLVYNMATIAEFKNLIAQGAIFVTDEFKKAAAIVEAKEEYFRREEVKNMGAIYVIHHDGRISFGRGADTDDVRHMGDVAVPEHLPEAIYNKYCILRMMEVGTHVPDVGLRESNDIFWLFGVSTAECEDVVNQAGNA